MNALPEPTQLIIGVSHKEMLTWMADNGIFCSTDKFTRLLQEAQRRAIEAQKAEAAK